MQIMFAQSLHCAYINGHALHVAAPTGRDKVAATRIIATARYTYNGQPANISEIINADSIEAAREVAEAMFARYEARGDVVTDKRLVDTATDQTV